MWWTLIISHLHLHWYSLLKLVGPLETHIMAWAHNYVSRKFRKKIGVHRDRWKATGTTFHVSLPVSCCSFAATASALNFWHSPAWSDCWWYPTLGTASVTLAQQKHCLNPIQRMNTSDWILLDISPIQWLDPTCPFFPAANFDCRNLGSWKLPCSSVTGPHSKAG